ncbi:hypothetical protein [Leptolyngbya sp. FACHB-16]|uniref:hypothetical protein n=1 Tax=unclassified Leptolyngbya TaxID=2650499 RepID=UPI001688C878|nr:hypothetical protein [Leptolyngbya sp. FACHB-16]MBD2157321.1 hypothetical protein [Leptolyngbya sp. FACHB-16]
MSSLTALKDCPICGSHDKRCRETETGTILCMTLTERVTGVDGYRFIRPTKNDTWGIWISDDAQQNDDWRRNLEERRAIQEHLEAQKRAASMSAEERDRHYQRLLSCLSLHPDDRTDLHRRGLSEAQIKAGQFVSVGKWQKLPEEFPTTLPGISLTGRSLNTSGDGYLCPVRDAHGLIVALQLRLRDPGDGGRYRWISSVTRKRPNGQPPNLPNGELPLAVFRPSAVSRQAIALVEGTGAKPFITSERLGIATIGAAGGQFASSPQTLRASLEILTAEAGTNCIEFFPDAGSIKNFGVLRQYKAAWQLLEEWGYLVQVAWWGQESKDDPDIDELENLGAIAFITPAEFLSLASCITGSAQVAQSVHSADNESPTLGEPDPIAYARYQAEQEAIEQAEAAEAAEQKPILEAQKAAEEQERRDRYRAETDRLMAEFNSLRVEPTLTLSGRYIPSGVLSLPEMSGTILIDGPMGVGKTSTALRELVEQHRRKFPGAFRCLLTPRNALGRQSADVLKLPHHTTFKGFGRCPNEVTLCPESGWRFPIRQLPDGPPLILIDEVSQLFHQVLEGKTSKQNHALILNWLRSLFRWLTDQNGWLVLSEDGITNLEIDLIQEACGPQVVDFLKFERPANQSRDISLFQSPSLTWLEIKKRIHTGENLILCSDSAKWLRETCEMAIATGLVRADEIYIMDSDSSSENWAEQLSTDPDKWVTQNRPRILGYSPTFQQGISITDPESHFQSMAIHLVHLDWRSAKQMPERLRSNVPRFGYVKPRSARTDDFFNSCRPDVIIRDFYRNVEGVEKLTQFAQYAQSKGITDADGNLLDLVGAIASLKASQDDPTSEFGFWLRYFARYQARGVYNRLSLREDLIKLWESRGYNIQIIGGCASAEQEEQEQIRGKLAIADAEVFAYLDTDEMSLSEARSILEELGATKEQRQLAHKRLLQDKLPGVDLNNPDFVLKTIILDNGRFLKTAELLWMARNPQAAQWLDRWTWLNEFTQATRRGQFVSYSRLSWRSGQAKLLHECPLHPFIEGKVEQWDNNSPEAIAVYKWALLRSHQFRRYLRLNISPTHTPVRTINKILRKLGFVVEEIGWKGGRENRERQYVITNLKDTDRNAILEALEERFMKRLEDKEGVSIPETPPAMIATCLDIPPLPSCDHKLQPDWTKCPLEILSMMQSLWADAKNEYQKQAVLDTVAQYGRAIAS